VAVRGNKAEHSADPTVGNDHSRFTSRRACIPVVTKYDQKLCKIVLSIPIYNSQSLTGPFRQEAYSATKIDIEADIEIDFQLGFEGYQTITEKSST
jgi:hypothetical protein